MNIFEKLMLAKELSFSEGSIELLGTRVVLPPASFFSEYIMRINDSPDATEQLYQSAKVSFRDGIAKTVGKKYGFSPNDFYKWLTEVGTMAGWGVVKWENFDKESKRGVIFFENSAVGLDLKGKVNAPVDHMIRGFLAGGISAIFNEDIDAIEEECSATGASKCKFVFGPASIMKANR